MKVARSHIVAAIEVADQIKNGKILFYPKYAIKAKRYAGKDKSTGEFGWTVSVVPLRPVKA